MKNMNEAIRITEVEMCLEMAILAMKNGRESDFIYYCKRGIDVSESFEEKREFENLLHVVL